MNCFPLLGIVRTRKKIECVVNIKERTTCPLPLPLKYFFMTSILYPTHTSDQVLLVTGVRPQIVGGASVKFPDPP